MRSGLLGRLLLASTILTLPMTAHAQEAAVSGIITDSSGGVLPGVAVRAAHEATGNAFETVTDERGAIAEVFNIFNRPNWTIGTEESTPSQYLRHINAQYRTAQVGFRLMF